VLEFAGPSARLLSVADRSVLCGIAPSVGAAAALFISDEKTEAYLRDQRRSKAHRTLVPDPGAPCEEVVSIDLATVDPLLIDDAGAVRPVRDLAGQPVAQVVLGGDSGVTLRDMLAAALLLKSKRVPSRLDLLVAPASRQVLEVLAESGALFDLVATGARILEPDRRLLTGEIYPPPTTGLSLRTSDPEPRVSGSPTFVVASAETLAYAVATGVVGDPRSFKRPVRVTIPRALPTDDVLILRDKKGEPLAAKKNPVLPTKLAWNGPLTLDVVAGLPRPNGRAPVAATRLSAPRPEAVRRPGAEPSPQGTSAKRPGLVLVLSSLDEVRATVDRYSDLCRVRAVLAPFIPSSAIAALASEGIATFLADERALASLRRQKVLTLPAPSQWGDTVDLVADAPHLEVSVSWPATGMERTWTHAGSARALGKHAAK